MHDLTDGKIIVTGAAGFIGSALIWALNQRGIENILAVDYLSDDERFKNLVPLRFDDYMEADTLIENLAESPSLYEDVRTIFHLGACSSTTEKDCEYLLKNNYEYTKILSYMALNMEARFVYASSAATYGDGYQGMDDNDPSLNRLRPMNMYGYSKHLFDLYAQKRGLLNEIVGLKYFNVFGPNESHKGNMRSVVHKAFEQIRDTGTMQLFKSYHKDYRDGEQMRDFLYVKDAVEMTLYVAENNDVGGLYNLGSGEANTWLTLADAIFSALDRPKSIEFIDMPDYLKSNYQYYTRADIGKLLETGYIVPITPLNEAVNDYIQNYLIPGVRLGDANEVPEFAFAGE